MITKKRNSIGLNLKQILKLAGLTVLPKRKQRDRLDVKQPNVIRSPSHRKWIRGFECAVKTYANTDCATNTECAHVRTGTDGGMGMKPSDKWCISLCSEHHREQHQMGEPAFERKYGFSMKTLAAAFWKASPHRRKFEP